jgi:hypothetical protein
LHTFGGLLEKLRRGGRLATPLRFLVKQYAISVFQASIFVPSIAYFDTLDPFKGR